MLPPFTCHIGIYLYKSIFYCTKLIMTMTMTLTIFYSTIDIHIEIIMYNSLEKQIPSLVAIMIATT